MTTTASGTMESSTEFKVDLKAEDVVYVKDEQIDSQVPVSHLPFSHAGLDSISGAEAGSHLLLASTEEPLKVDVKEEPLDGQPCASLPASASRLTTATGSLSSRTEYCWVSDGLTVPTSDTTVPAPTASQHASTGPAPATDNTATSHMKQNAIECSDASSKTASVPILLVDELKVVPIAAEMPTEQPQSPLQEEGVEAQSPEVATQPQENGRKKAASVFLSEAVEVDLGQWLQEHPCLYNKGLKEYKNKALKDRLYEEKAKTIGITGKELRTWFDSMRTRYGKLTREKSGQGAPNVKEHTDRDKWILNLLHFLETHIVRQKTRAPGCKPDVGPPAAPAPASVATPPSSDVDACSGVEEDGEDQQEPHADVSRPSSSAPPNKRKKAMPEEAMTSLLKKLEQREVSNREQFELMSRQLTPPSDPLALWARTLGEEARQLSTVRQRYFRMEVQGTLERYLNWESEGYTPSSLVECVLRGQGVAVASPYPPTSSHPSPLAQPGPAQVAAATPCYVPQQPRTYPPNQVFPVAAPGTPNHDMNLSRSSSILESHVTPVPGQRNTSIPHESMNLPTKANTGLSTLGKGQH